MGSLLVKALVCMQLYVSKRTKTFTQHTYVSQSYLVTSTEGTGEAVTSEEWASLEQSSEGERPIWRTRTVIMTGFFWIKM